MSGLTKIEWADVTWNWWSGCREVSPGCAHCYAKTWAERFRGQGAFPQGFELTYRSDKTRDWPLTHRAPADLGRPWRIFVNSMSDVFLEDVPLERVQQLFDVMVRAPWHDFLILTKRAERMVKLAPQLPWPPNVWMGVSIENRRFVHRAELLIQVPAAVRFVSAEPLLGPVELGPILSCSHLSLIGDEGPIEALGRMPRRWRCNGCNAVFSDLAPIGRRTLDWLIVGGESGHGARPMELHWARDLVAQCRAAGVAPFIKQIGTVAAGGRGKGGDMERWPADLRIREFPA